MEYLNSNVKVMLVTRKQIFIVQWQVSKQVYSCVIKEFIFPFYNLYQHIFTVKKGEKHKSLTSKLLQIYTKIEKFS